VSAVRLRPVETFLAHGRVEVVVFVLLVAAIVKSGVAFEVVAQSPEPAFPLPEPGIAATSYGMPVLVTVLQLTGNAAAIGLTMLALTLVALFVFARTVFRSGRDTGLLVAGLVLLGPIGIAAFGNVGRHDWFLLVGSLLFALKGTRLGWGITAAVLMVLGNPEQALLASVALLLLTFVSPFRELRRSAMWAVVLIAVVMVGLTVWVELLGLDSRTSWIGFHVLSGLKTFLLNLPLSIYAAYGAGWVLVGILLWRTQGRSRWLAAIALLVIPLGATALTDDQTRVFVGVSTVVAVVVFQQIAADGVRWLETTFAGVWRTFLVGGLLLLPAIEITYLGGVRTPYEWIFDFLTSSTQLGPT